MRPTDRQIRAAAIAIMSYRGFGYTENPDDGGQDLYDMSCDVWNEASEALNARGGVSLEDFVCHLATWPRDGAANKDELLDAILALCGVWTKRLNH